MGPSSLTVNCAVLPSLTVTSLMDSPGLSLSSIVPSAVAFPSVTPLGALNRTVKVSSPSYIWSSVVCTSMTANVVSAGIVSVSSAVA